MSPLELYEIKHAVFDLTNKDFVEFEEWFFELGGKRLTKGIKLNELRRAVLNLSKKDLELFETWFEDLCDERWAEEVKNDPMAQDAIKLGNLIMSKPDPGKYLADLLSGRNEANGDE